MKNTLLFIFCIVAFSAKAQNDYRNTGDRNDSRSSGIAVSLGAAANYYYGPGNQNFDKYQSDRLNWQINGMLGLTIARSQSGRRTMIAGFGSFGINNDETVKQIFEDQKYITTANNQSSANNVYNIQQNCPLYPNPSLRCL